MFTAQIFLQPYCLTTGMNYFTICCKRMGHVLCQQQKIQKLVRITCPPGASPTWIPLSAQFFHPYCLLPSGIMNSSWKRTLLFNISALSCAVRLTRKLPCFSPSFGL
ncbi:hCG1730040 [Homo sapiens]|nr:hypothetical protein DKFZp547G183.1 - human [Homo sapiens]EAW75085.1 hCG1730040 [Homo sapiens]